MVRVCVSAIELSKGLDKTNVTLISDQEKRERESIGICRRCSSLDYAQFPLDTDPPVQDPRPMGTFSDDSQLKVRDPAMNQPGDTRPPFSSDEIG